MPPPPNQEDYIHPKPSKASPFAIQGVVYCNPFKYPPSNLLHQAFPLPYGRVRVVCNGGEIVDKRTDTNGYYFAWFEREREAYDPSKECEVLLVSSHNGACKRATDVNGGIKGAALKLEKKLNETNTVLYSSGPLVFAY
ncbi:hypothetical protein AMTRI_Chr13g84830 [Amborella trichopoda]